MTANVGTVDRIFRFILGIVLLAAPFVSGMPLFDSALIKGVSMAVGAIMILVATVRVCPIYSIFGIRTCKV